MELIPVNSQKLKIILTKDDMASFDITSDDLDYSSAKTRKALGNILERAKNETGFNIHHDRLYIQVFPSVDGGCEMFLTRRARLLPEPEAKGCTYLKKKYGSAFEYPSECGKYIARSEDFEDIVSLCLRLYKENFFGRSSLHTIGKDYLLKLDFGHADDLTSDFSRFSFICDYCSVRYADDIPAAYIDEHGKVLIKENAVETIWKNFGEQ